MKKRIFSLLALILALILSMTIMLSCDKSDSGDSDDDKAQSSSSSGGSSDDNGNGNEEPEESTSKQDPINGVIIVFNANGGSRVEPIEVKRGEKASAPIAPTREGYFFDGWYLNDKKWSFESDYVTVDIILTAKWTPNQNLLSFSANGGSGTMAPLTVGTGETITLDSCSFVRDGYNFMGWSTSPTGKVEYENGAQYTMGTSRSYALFAVWEAKDNSLVLVANNGTSAQEKFTAKTNTQFQIPTPSFENPGYCIVGWSTTPGGAAAYDANAQYTMGPSNEYVLYAIWDLNTNDVILDMNDGSGATSLVNFKAFEIGTLPLNQYVRAGYIFQGWALTPDGQISYLDGGAYASGVEKTTVLYAVWDAIEYTLVYHNAPDLLVNEIKFTVADLPITLPKLNNEEDFLFECWYSNEQLTGEPLTKITKPGNVDVYPSFVEGTDGLVLVEIKGEWTVAGYTGESDADVIIPSYFQGKPVTVIGEDAFSGQNYITSVTLPSTLKTICDGAFLSCHSLEYIEIPSTVTTIEPQAFVYCRSLQSVIIPAGVTEIGRRTFYDCWALESVIFLGGVTKIGSEAFKNCYDLADVHFPNTLVEIGDNAFRNCERSLLGIELPNGVKTLGDYCFYGCDVLETVILPNTITKIGEGAFGFCKKLETINIPTSLTKIDKNTFEYCMVLDSIVIPSSVKTIDDAAFADCRALESINIPDSVTKIGSRAFDYCISLETVTISSTSKLTTIGTSAFLDCKALVSISLPGTLTSIGADAFCNCSSLITIRIPASVTSMGANAFKDCTKLYIYCEAASRPIAWSANWNSSDRSVFWGQ